MDIYAKVKYNKPKDLIEVVNQALGQNMQIEKAQENTGV